MRTLVHLHPCVHLSPFTHAYTELPGRRRTVTGRLVGADIHITCRRSVTLCRAEGPSTRPGRVQHLRNDLPVSPASLISYLVRDLRPTPLSTHTLPSSHKSLLLPINSHTSCTDPSVPHVINTHTCIQYFRFSWENPSLALISLSLFSRPLLKNLHIYIHTFVV